MTYISSISTFSLPLTLFIHLHSPFSHCELVFETFVQHLNDGSYHDVPSTDKLQPRLKDGDVQDVNEVAQVVGQQPVVNILWSLVGKGPAHWDEPHVPVPGQADQHHPQHVHQVWGRKKKDEEGMERRSHAAQVRTSRAASTRHIQRGKRHIIENIFQWIFRYLYANKSFRFFDFYTRQNVACRVKATQRNL